jgi:hypothetical protein
MKKLLSAILIMLAMTVSSQENKLNKKVKLNFFILYGIESQCNGSLNDFLVANNYNSLSELQFPTYTALGVGFKNIDDPFMSQIIISKNNTNSYNNENSSSITSYGMAVNALYDLCKNQKWIFAPLLGISISNNTLTAVSKNTISSLSGSLLEESFQKNNVLGLKLGANAEREIIIYNFAFNIGINAYYNLNLGNKYWYSIDNSSLNNIPSVGKSGFGVHFKLGCRLN